jgi:predicted RNA polymerase sigma factor
MENYTYTVYDSWNADSLNSSPQSWLLLYAAHLFVDKFRDSTKNSTDQ